jgi:ketosteroid isomerase-like protein
MRRTPWPTAWPTVWTISGILLSALAAPLAPAAAQPLDPGNRAIADELLRTDSEFAALSKQKGAAAAFSVYIADDVRMMSPGQPMQIGRDKALALFTPAEPGEQLLWEPQEAAAAASGDLGFTWGIAHSTRRLPDGNLRTTESKYVTIWRKQQDGSWKFVLDGGNGSAPPPKP